ncbi:hypothetical protein NC651_003855 [Populus alba x Populus x berolinensis]|nr:hypothetical protein NC651_003855 [Populus alba x Populus x berolinensis]
MPQSTFLSQYPRAALSLSLYKNNEQQLPKGPFPRQNKANRVAADHLPGLFLSSSNPPRITEKNTPFLLVRTSCALRMASRPLLLSKTFSVLVSGFVVLNCFVVDKFGSHAQGITPLLPLDEVQILQNISNKLNISNWATIDRTSCDSAEWNQTIDSKTQSIVTCNCTFENGSVCHVTNMYFLYFVFDRRVKGFNLNGVLPEELGDLPHLLEIDLTRNYINGTIPPRLAQLPNLKKL